MRLLRGRRLPARAMHWMKVLESRVPRKAIGVMDGVVVYVWRKAEIQLTSGLQYLTVHTFISLISEELGSVCAYQELAPRCHSRIGTGAM